MSAQSGNSLSVASGSSVLQGMHIYTITSKPVPTTGIEKPEQVTDYFGTFKVGTASASYTITGEKLNAGCYSYMFRRPDNTATTWSKVNQATQPQLPTYSSTAAQNQLALNTSVKQQITGNSTFCTGAYTTLTINTTGEVLWSTGETTKSIQVSKQGNYSATINEEGCTYTSQLTVSEVTLPIVALGPDRNICSGEVIQLSAPSGNYTYKWNTGATSPTIAITETGIYWVEVTNSAGCTVKDEINITVKPAATINLPETLNACYGDLVTLDASTDNASYRWSNGQTSASVTITAPADVTVTITIDGCEYVRQVRVLSDECPIIPNIITPNGDGKNDTFVLKGINTDAIEIQIFNRWGKSIYKRTGYDNMWVAEGANNGIYYYHIKSRATQKEYKGWVEVLK